MNDRSVIDLLPSGESELVFELGGPAYRMMQRIGVIKGAGPSVARRTVAFIAVTWLPLLVLTVLEGHALGPTPRSAFLLQGCSTLLSLPLWAG